MAARAHASFRFLFYDSRSNPSRTSGKLQRRLSESSRQFHRLPDSTGFYQRLRLHAQLKCGASVCGEPDDYEPALAVDSAAEHFRWDDGIGCCRPVVRNSNATHELAPGIV